MVPISSKNIGTEDFIDLELRVGRGNILFKKTGEIEVYGLSNDEATTEFIKMVRGKFFESFQPPPEESKASNE